MNNNNSSNSDFFHFAIPSNLTEIKKETKLNANKLVSNEDVRFYSKRIVMLTNKLLNGGNETDIIDEAFSQYLFHCIEHFKFMDKHEMIQKKILVESENSLNSVKQDIPCENGIDKVNKLNDAILNKKNKTTKTISIRDFVKNKSSNKKINKKEYPKIQSYNLKKSEFKEKGIHKKKSN